ncbi:2-amino-4-hydroxy-6-hydroxymethyldihydropteridine diphosphokinase [Spirulina subsalsa]|uniref:2-amino-4-hydroxy-6- hydroxymethyldihydropteridine diphosphokinase n=1 Tax=Spirulina subsalsa TaxID=54311 RepID=UPI00035DF8D3|nr:2-amino-4-hydroxy-6-hydroxymethyldihydropteridine diphosphokinase [Spirulina subsalsa]
MRSAFTKCRVAIALGSNLTSPVGDSLTILNKAIATLNQSPGIQVKLTSSWYKTAPVGPPQPDYFNGCAVLEVELSPRELLGKLLEIERQFGRVRREPWGPRTLDLDLLLYEDWVLETPPLQIPHPRMTQRAFVLLPLAEIAPDWIEPISGMAIAQLASLVDSSGVNQQQGIY